MPEMRKFKAENATIVLPDNSVPKARTKFAERGNVLPLRENATEGPTVAVLGEHK